LLDKIAEKNPDSPSTLWSGVARSFAQVKSG
jgi:hypothetical protein